MMTLLTDPACVYHLKFTRASCTSFPDVVTPLSTLLPPISNSIPFRDQVKGTKYTLFTLFSPSKSPCFRGQTSFTWTQCTAVKPEGRGGMEGQRAIVSLNLEAPDGLLSSCALTSQGGWGHGHGGVPSHREGSSAVQVAFEQPCPWYWGMAWWGCMGAEGLAHSEPGSSCSSGYVLLAYAVSVLVFTKWKQFDSPASDGLHYAVGRQPA